MKALAASVACLVRRRRAFCPGAGAASRQAIFRRRYGERSAARAGRTVLRAAEPVLIVSSRLPGVSVCSMPKASRSMTKASRV